MSPGWLESLRRGATLFDQRCFFEAHEVWEDAWRVERGEPALFLHGLIQVAAGFVKLQRGEPRGTVSLLRKGASKLERFRPSRYGLDVDRTLSSVTHWEEAAAWMVASGTTEFDAEGLPRLALAAEV